MCANVIRTGEEPRRGTRRDHLPEGNDDTMSNPFANAGQNTTAQNTDQNAGADQTASTPAAPKADAAANQFASPSGQSAGDPAALFGAARSGDQHKLKDDLGCFVVVRVLSHELINTAYGETEAIRADWVPVDGPNAGQVRENGLIFGRALVPAMKANLDRGVPFTIGTVIEGQAKAGQSAPILLSEPTDEQAAKAVEVARYLNWIK